MPPLPVITNTFLVTQHYTATNARHDFITRFCIGTADTSLAQIADDVADQIKANILLMMSSEITLGNTDVLPLDGTSSTSTFTTDSAGSAGGDAAGTPLPYSSCFLTTWQTGLRGRSKRGRTYWPGVRTDRVVHPESNVLNPADVSNLTTLSAGIITGLQGEAIPKFLQVLSIKHGFVNTVQNARGNPSVAVQRRRYERVARH